MIRKITITLSVIICFILQCSLFYKLSFGGIIPNLMIILTSSIGVMRGEKEGIYTGFLAGILCDIFFGNFLGFYALIMMYIGYLNGKFSRGFYPEDIKLPIALIITSDISYGLVCYVLLYLLRGKFNFTYYLTHIIIPEALYTIVVTMVLYPIVLKIHNIFENHDRRSDTDFV